MAAHTWIQDSPSGPWKNSYQLLKRAAGQTKILPTMDVSEAILRRLQGEASRIIDRALCCEPPWYSINDELEAEAARENSEADYPEAYGTVDGMTIEEFSQWRQGNAKLS